MPRFLWDMSTAEYWGFLLLCGLVCAVIAEARGRRGGAWFVLGFLLGWFALPILLFLSSRKRCLFCMTRIHAEASICPACRSPQSQETAARGISGH